MLYESSVIHLYHVQKPLRAFIVREGGQIAMPMEQALNLMLVLDLIDPSTRIKPLNPIEPTHEGV